jgi:heavy metal sensor kinase
MRIKREKSLVMRSIRLSLVVYFLVLIALALGGISWFVYQTTGQTLRAKEADTRELIQAQYVYQCAEVRTALDRRILSQAKTLANRARSSNNHFELLYPLGILATRLQPQGYLNASFWWSAGFNPRVSGQLHRMRPGDIAIEEPEELIPVPDAEHNQPQEYFQTYSKRGMPQQRSEAMGDRVFTLDEDFRAKADFLEERFDTIEPVPGWKLRRVTLKAAVMTRFRPSSFPPAWRNIAFNVKNGPKGPKPQFAGPFDVPVPVVFIQYASDMSLMEQKRGEFQTECDAKLARVESDTRAALAGLRLRLLWISLATFAGVLAGGFVLVRLGLAPLARLSDAVSQVSEKDFSLKVAPHELPKELKPIAVRLTDTLEQLKQAFAREKQAAADISHELRTPLAAMMTTLELALRKSRSAEEYREMLEDIRTSGSQMTHLVERLLALARLDAGANRLENKDFDARDVARQCADLIRPLAEARGLALRLSAPEPVPLKADPDKLREIINNLLHNAVEYNRPQGAVNLHVSRVNGYVHLKVSDTGIGIAPEERGKIFERFFRADPSRHADTPHAGLGLAIVKSYVDLMGGKIGVDSGAQGTSFTVDLPAASLAPND